MKFRQTGLLAIAPAALDVDYEQARVESDARNGVAIVNVRGALQHHDDFFFDSYDAIKRRVGLALASNCKAVVLNLDTPGGLVSGCFDTVREIRAMVAAAGKPLYAYVDGDACSAGYALACAASGIWIAEAGSAGSIGIIGALRDETAALERAGVRVAIVTSGARKADGNPLTPLTDDKIAAASAQVDATAQVFFALVSEARGLSVADVQALQAATFTGAQAVACGLADGVLTFDDLLAQLASGNAPLTGSKGEKMDYKEAVAALRKAAEGDDENAKAARRALAAIDTDEKKDDDKAKAEDEKKDDDKAKAEDEKKDDDKAKASDDDEEEAKAEDEKKDDDKAKASKSDPALAALAKVQELEAKLAAKEEAEERRALMATRPDFAPEVVAYLNKQPLAAVRDAVKVLPKGKPQSPVRDAIAAIGAQPTAGATEPVSRLSAEEAAELDRRMGLTSARAVTRLEGTKFVMGAPTPKEGK